MALDNISCIHKAKKNIAFKIKGMFKGQTRTGTCRINVEGRISPNS